MNQTPTQSPVQSNIPQFSFTMDQMEMSTVSTPLPNVIENSDSRNQQISNRRVEIVQTITSLNYVITDQERKIEHLKLKLEEESNKLAEYRNELGNLKTEQKLMTKAQKVVNQKKRRIAVDDFHDQLDDYINEPEEGKCSYFNDRNRKCTKPAVKELEGREYCKQHYGNMVEAKLAYYQTKMN
jgi:uncharacterized coiled-coil protein SlyX